MKKTIWLWVLALMMVLAIPATAEEVTEIRTVQELQAVANNPEGSYILMEDLDMTGIDWKPIDFYGSLDGNGHAILNLELSQPGDTTAKSCDGNSILYESWYVGLFGILKEAEVRDLKLINVRGLVETDNSCFLAGLAGYCEASTITGCTVTGNLELRAHDRMFGVGGIAGYGSGHVRDCTVDVTLICTDTDQTRRDEQFMGGILATGFMDIENCTVTIDGYSSEYGYAHNGGLVGMLMRHPLGDWTCNLQGNSVIGKITFFEVNSDRRAYCKGLVGEFMTSYRTESDNTVDFVNNEQFVYDAEIRPEMCQEPEYEQTVVESDCTTYGHTVYTCTSCGYRYTDDYQLLNHMVTEWTLKEAPTTEKEGLSVGYCSCGLEFTRTEEKLEPIPTEAPTMAPEMEPAPIQPAPAEPEVPVEKTNLLLPAVIGGIVVLILLLLIFGRKKKGGKYLRK
ncbi:MAG: hypothetical protein J6B95_08585 [Oscillospiraceae bacterium]|nr:hypothetical protein [Oscillospiraceae bacterium]